MMHHSLADPLWRVANLYGVKDAETGIVRKFEPRKEQQEVFGLLNDGYRRIIILKSRRLGMSTAIDIWGADQTIWRSGFNVSVLDQTKEDAASKIDNIVKPAYEFMPDALRSRIATGRKAGGKWTSSALNFRIGSNDISTFYGGKRARGGTNHFLHVSEWGVIQADDPKRSAEILTGALPSAQHGVIVVETTWKGGRGGHLWNLIEQSMKIPEELRTKDDWHVVFYPWHTDPSAVLDGGEVPQECMTYLNGLGIELTTQQRAWYAKNAWPLKELRYREYPSTFDECFKTPMDGAIYADLLDRARLEGRITDGNIWDRSNLVWTVWDLGGVQNTATWYFQSVAGEIRLIDYDEGLKMTVPERVAHMLAKGYSYAGHLLPHDASAEKMPGVSWESLLRGAGLQGLHIIPRTHDEMHGINRMREMLPVCRFSTKCEKGVAALCHYHTKTVQGSAGSYTTAHIVHDWSSHGADAFRYIGEAMLHGMLKGVGVAGANKPKEWWEQSRGKRGLKAMRVG